ncbi:MAG: hypothetical protein ACLP3K_13420 [Candidatus Acidiferrales bacterium]
MNRLQPAGLAQTIERFASYARIPHLQQTFDNEPLDRARGNMQFTGESRPGETFHMDAAALTERGEAISYRSFRAMQHLGDYANALIACKVQERSVIVLGPGETRTLLTTFGSSLNEPAFSCVLPDYVRPPIRMALQELADSLSLTLPSSLVPFAQGSFVFGTPDRMRMLPLSLWMFQQPYTLPQL